jgi:hypothetical protein
MRETGAAGYALYRFTPGEQSPVCLSCCGASIPDGAQEGVSVARFRLHTDDAEVGLVAFVFQAPEVSENAHHVLERLARTIESIWSLSGAPDTVVELATRVGQLQHELADLKIAERARGFLAHAEPNASGILARHVEGVLQARRLEALLTGLARELQEQINERKVIAHAKYVLQKAYGLSEEQAYARLRATSRKSRRRLGVVAQQFIEREYDTQST